MYRVPSSVRSQRAASFFVRQQIAGGGEVYVPLALLPPFPQEVPALGTHEHLVRKQFHGVAQSQGNGPQVAKGHAEPGLISFQQLAQVEKAILVLQAVPAGPIVIKQAASSYQLPLGMACPGGFQHERNNIVEQAGIDLSLIYFQL